MSQEQSQLGINTYERWAEAEGVPIIRDYSIADLRDLPMKPWKRKGGKGAILNLVGSTGVVDCYVCEIPPGEALKPQRHLYEEIILILGGRGATTIWQEGGKKQTLEWQEGSAFAPPLNAWHQHFNGSGSEPALYVAVTHAPTALNTYHRLDFIFNNPFIFNDRYSGEDGYFNGEGKSYPHRMWETNFIADVRSFKLQDWRERGAGSKNVMFELSNNVMACHVSEFPVGTYKKAHRHGPAAHIIILNGQGYTMMWEQGKPPMKFDWQPGSLVVPPNMWFHQHFNTSREPARYFAVRSRGSRKFIHAKVLGGEPVEYRDEDPGIRRIFEEELANGGLKSQMEPFYEASRKGIDDFKRGETY